MITIDDLQTVLGLDFSLASSELAEARQRQRLKDSPANRADLAECRARVDAVLDMYLESGAFRR
ncbi:MAG: hypothetical protein JWO98_2962 [Frankiales bacterium]|jgi:hypothetical protein|nr:hypothetical protein [Frankiales bacterium]